MTVQEIREQFPVGTKVEATIYALRHKDIWEPQKAVIVGSVSDQQMKEGFRFGLFVEYEGQKYWVYHKDVKKLQKDCQKNVMQV